MSIERELKFHLPLDDLRQLTCHPVLQVVAQSTGTRELTSDYFDTPDRKLSGAGMALRIRRDGERRILTLKSSPATASLQAARGEWERDVEHDKPQAADLRQLHAYPLSRLEPLEALAALLVPAFGTQFQRQTWLVELDNSSIEIALDQGWYRAGADASSAKAPLRELELECLAGDVQAAYVVAWALAQDLPLIPNPVPKAVRAQRLAEQAANGATPCSIKLEQPQAQRTQTLGDFIAASLDVHCTAVLLWRERVLSESDIEPMHQLRVSLRRLRSLIRTLRAYQTNYTREWFGTELRWAGTLSGTVRDRDVWLQELWSAVFGSMARNEAVIAAAGALKAERDAAFQATASYLDSARFGRLMIALSRWAYAWQCGEIHKANLSPQAHAKKVINQSNRQLGAALQRVRHAGNNVTIEELHRVRILAKRLRYCIDAYEPVCALPQNQLKTVRKKAAQIQDRLGQLNDADRLLQGLASSKAQANVISSAAEWRTGVINRCLLEIAAK
jgi:inorganic triphosphatase YgiF